MKYEDRIHARRKVILTLSAIVYVVATIMAFRGVGFQLMGLGGRCDLPGAIWIASGIALIIALCRYIEHNRFLSFIGVFPAFIGMVARHIFSDGNYIVTIAVAALSIALAWIVTMIIIRYLPFLIDIRNIKRG